MRVRAITAQHGDIHAMLDRRGCKLEFVEIVSDPNFSICKDYVAKGLDDLVFDTQERPQVLAPLVELDGFKDLDAARHNVVQPALWIENTAGDCLYKWTWKDLDGSSGFRGDPWEGKANKTIRGGGWTVFLRPTTDSLLDALIRGSFMAIDIDIYPNKWPRANFGYARSRL